MILGRTREGIMLSAILVLLIASVLSSAVNFIYFSHFTIALSCAFAVLAAAVVLAREKWRKEGLKTYGQIDGVTLDFNREGAAARDVDPEIAAMKEECERLNREVAQSAGVISRQGDVVAHVRERISSFGPEPVVDDMAKSIAEMRAVVVDSRRITLGIKEKLETDVTDFDKIVAELRSSLLSLSGARKRRAESHFVEGGEVRSFVSSLEESSDQMNIIAINAAIEAARVGKEGRGFSVIAGEMQKLSGEIEILAQGLRKYGENQAAYRREVENAVFMDTENDTKTDELINRLYNTATAIAENVDSISAPNDDGPIDDLLGKIGLIVERYGMVTRGLEELQSLLGNSDG